MKYLFIIFDSAHIEFVKREARTFASEDEQITYMDSLKTTWTDPDPNRYLIYSFKI